MHAADKMMTAVVVLTVVILALSILLSRRRALSNEDELTKRGRKCRNNWLGNSVTFLIIYYWCILISILSTVIVLYLSCFEDATQITIKARLIVYSALSLFTSVCPYIVNFLKLSKKFRLAYCVLEAQLLTQGNIAKAIIDGEKIISSAFED